MKILSLHADTDVLLFSRIKAGDEQALRELFRKYYAGLCTFAYAFIANKEQVEELVADVFMKVWEKRETIDITSNVKAYLYTITKNQALAYLQKSRPSFQSIDKLPLHLAVDYVTPEEQVSSTEFFQGLNAIINTLPGQCRLVFIMHKMDGFSYQEIAGILQISVKTVENQMGKALKLVREQLLKKPLHASKILYFLSITVW